jgi:hypothetical protein
MHATLRLLLRLLLFLFVLSLFVRRLDVLHVLRCGRERLLRLQRAQVEPRHYTGRHSSSRRGGCRRRGASRSIGAGSQLYALTIGVFLFLHP